jgi:hypothetical protein
MVRSHALYPTELRAQHCKWPTAWSRPSVRRSREPLIDEPDRGQRGHVVGGAGAEGPEGVPAARFFPGRISHLPILPNLLPRHPLTTPEADFGSPVRSGNRLSPRGRASYHKKNRMQLVLCGLAALGRRASTYAGLGPEVTRGHLRPRVHPLKAPHFRECRRAVQSRVRTNVQTLRQTNFPTRMYHSD